VYDLEQLQQLQMTLMLTAILCPSVHEAATLLKEIGPAVGCLGLAFNSMGESHFYDFTREVRALCSPIAKRRPKAVRGYIAPIHASEHH
jgi:hypothetical protein